MEELLKLHNVYDHEKQESKALKMNVADFREEVLKIKREKQKIADDLKIKEEEYGNFKSRLDVLNTANAA